MTGATASFITTEKEDHYLKKIVITSIYYLSLLFQFADL